MGGGKKSDTGRDSAHASISRNNQHDRLAEALRGLGKSFARIRDCTVDSDSPVISATTSDQLGSVLRHRRLGITDRVLAFY
jgi:hypothetical protein